MRADLRVPAGQAPAITYAGIGDEAGASLRAQVQVLAALGWWAIELRTVDGLALADLDDRHFASVADLLATAGLDVVCVASRIGNWARSITGAFDEDRAELDILAGRCATLGTPYVRIMSYPNDGLTEREWRHRSIDRIRLLADRAERAGLVLLHENCSGWAGASAERMLHLLDEVGSPALRLLFDTGNGIAHGYHATDMLADIVAHVEHVHVKDAEPGAAGPVYTLPGEGSAQVAECLRLLLAHGYTGAWSIEPHLSVLPHERSPVTDPMAGGRPPREIAEDAGARFTAAGTTLQRLVRDQVLPRCSGWSQECGGRIARRQ